MKRVFITRSLPEGAVDYLEKKGYDVSVYPNDSPIPRRELIKKTKYADAVISLLTENFDRELIDNMEKCRVIANYAVGYNNIDVEYARKKNIIVTNTPDVLTDSTADLAVTLALMCARRTVEGINMLKQGKYKGWKPKLLMGIEPKGKTFGIIGAGRIGTAVGLRMKSFGVKIVYFSQFTNKVLEKETGARKISLNKLLHISDFVSVHLPLTTQTRHLLNDDKLALLKKDAILINTARGEIIDEKALIKVLKNKKIFAAGLDVFEGEPAVNKELLELENAVILPHIGSATREARRGMAMLAAKNVHAVLSGKRPLTPV